MGHRVGQEHHRRSAPTPNGRRTDLPNVERRFGWLRRMLAARETWDQRLRTGEYLWDILLPTTLAGPAIRAPVPGAVWSVSPERPEAGRYRRLSPTFNLHDS